MVKRDIDRELEFHVEELVQLLVDEGMPRADAQREAQRRFGDVDQYRGECASLSAGRDGRRAGLGIAAQDLVYALRTLRRSPVFTLSVVGILALGIGANTALFSVIHGVLMRPMGFTDPGGLVALHETNNELGVTDSPSSASTVEDWRRGAATLSSVAAWQWRSMTLQDPTASRELQAAQVSPNYFTTLGVQPLLGRAFLPDDAAPGETGGLVLLSHALWTDRFGQDPDILGKGVELDGQTFQIIGVMPRRHVAPSTDADIWIPTGFTGPVENRGLRQLRVVGRLAGSATIEQASQEIKAISERIAREYPTSALGWSARAEALRDQIVGSAQRSLAISFGAVALLLLIACTNIASLLLARAATREKEIALRSALGAGRGRIMRQLLTESTVLSLLGGGAGILLAFVAHRLLIALEPGVLPRVEAIELDPVVLLFAGALSLLTEDLKKLLRALVE